MILLWMLYRKHKLLWHPEVKPQFLTQGVRKPSITLSLRLIVHHFPIINHPCSVPFIFKAVYLSKLPVLCVLCLYRSEWMTQAVLSIKQQPPDHQWLPIDSRPYTSTGSSPSSAQWVTNLQVLNQTADKRVEGSGGDGRRGACVGGRIEK